MDDVRSQISQLEERIERLREALERCHKIAVAAKAAITCGGIWLVLIVFAVVRADALALVIAAILILGGIVLAGSNATTARQTQAGIDEAERMRAALIGQIDLRLVPEQSRMLH